ncbi:MAG: LacI family DNA-binding transcriptional regulator [Actinobacteria bacterium]|nr:LacI family DNA-binding transcriptional regulator [Actinomycetota bacterium]
MGNTTLRDIAIRTGFSVKTVSRALNNHPDISEETKNKILKVAEELSYRPNLIAKSLRQKKAFAIGYVIPDITNEFFGEVALAIESEFKKHNYSLLTSFTNSNPELEVEALKLLMSRQVDGIILATVGTTGNFIKEIVEGLKVPIVVIDNRVKGYKTNVVLHDNVKGAYLLTQHLIKHGHKDIACISGPLLETSGKRRLEGYKNALTEAGIEIDEELIKVSDWKISGGYQSTLELFIDSHKKPTAIFVGNSVMALGSLKALRELKLRVPEDIALVSFDNLRFTEATYPPLTTLKKVEDKIGVIASQMLLKKIKSKDLANIEEVLVDAELCIRESCGCKAGVDTM